MKLPKKMSLGAAAFVLAIALLIYFFFDDARAQLIPLFEWIEGIGPWGIFWFIVIYIAFVILTIPSFPLTLAAGFMFGIVQGSLYVLSAIMIGAMIAFFLARYLVSEYISGKMKKYPKLKRINDGLGHEGWKIIMLCRLVPFFPAKFSNYFFGVTRISVRGFFVGNLFGVIPYTVLNVWIGSLAANLARLGEREPTGTDWIIYAVGTVAGLLLVIYITRLARGAMDRSLASSDE